MLREIATTKCKLSLSNGMTATGITISCQNSENFKINSSNVYYGNMTVTLTDVISGPDICPSVIITIKPTSKNIAGGIEGSAILRKGDNGSAEAAFINATTSVPAGTKTVEVTITDAGQTEVKSE